MQTKVKKSYICRQVGDYQMDSHAAHHYIPRAGDVALFSVVSIGKHSRMQCSDGFNHLILPGDVLMCAFGSRYATNQIEGYVPDGILDEYHLLAQGGVAGVVHSMYKTMEDKGPTVLRMMGYATDLRGNIINTQYLGHTKTIFNGLKPFDTKIILSLGTSMDSGKTTTAAYLCRGLSRAKQKTAYMKLTGTAFSKDADLAADCGAHSTVDFSHVGFPSTFLCHERELLDLYATLLETLRKDAPQVVVIEIADGLLQRETAMLLHSASFLDTIDGVVFSAGDSMGALYGVQYLEQLAIKPLLLGGLFTMSPLLVREVSEHTDIPVYNLQMLEQPEVSQIFSTDYVPHQSFDIQYAMAAA